MEACSDGVIAIIITTIMVLELKVHHAADVVCCRCCRSC